MELKLLGGMRRTDIMSFNTSSCAVDHLFLLNFTEYKMLSGEIHTARPVQSSPVPSGLALLCAVSQRI